MSLHFRQTGSPGAPEIVSGFREIADSYDAALCDVWGVLHDGRSARADAANALREFRQRRGPVILLSNAPRPVGDVEAQLAKLGVPDDCYDAILTSGVLAREDLARRGAARELKLLHIGPERDRGVFSGLRISCVEPDEAELVLCTGLFDDEAETPEDYRETLCSLKNRQLALLCVNPDIVVRRGGKLVWCAGALARLYEHLGGTATYYGKPHQPIYDAALKLVCQHAGRNDLRVLVVGDGLETDIRGANAAGLDALFIADGIHGEEIGEVTPVALEKLCSELGVFAVASMRALVW